MAYEIDFIGVKAEKCSSDADAICIRWKSGMDWNGDPIYKVGVIDGGYTEHGDAMVNHMNKYYFGDENGYKDPEDKTIDFIIVTHPDQDHTTGLKKIFENYTVKKLYMNRPWLYIDELWEQVSDGRITEESLKKRLREKYKTVADIEDIAEEQNIPIFDAFQGANIENVFKVLSPTKNFYLDLLLESDKTPLQEKASPYEEGIFGKIFKTSKALVLKLLENWNVETLREDVSTTPENETSIVIRGMIDGDGLMLTGDAGLRALNMAIDYMECIGEDVISDISFYQIPHHGGRHNVSPSLLDRMLGKKVKEGTTVGKQAYASVAEKSDHPLKMVTNAYIRRGVKTYCNAGNTIRFFKGDMPERNWSPLAKIEFSNFVEEWDV